MTWRPLARILAAAAALSATQMGLVVAAVAAGCSARVSIVVAVVAAYLMVWALIRLTGAVRVRRRCASDRGGRFRPAVAGATVVLLASALSAVLYLAPDDVRPTPDQAATLRLPDGTALAVRVHHPDATAEPPVVVVHGGPGVPLTTVEEDRLTNMAPERRVVVYDQIGTGSSTRLTDPRGYTMDRAAADLDHVVATLEAPRVVLVGYSWGAQVATVYAARHPDAVAGLLALSPGAVPRMGVATEPDQPQRRLTPGQSVGLYARALTPRNLFMYLLTEADIGTAHQFGGDAEMDHRYEALYLAAGPGLHCAADAPLHVPTGLGYYANQNPQVNHAHTPLTPTQLDALRDTPAAVLRGDCDYIEPDAAHGYTTVFSSGPVIAVPGSGHALVEDRPDVVAFALRDLLARPH